MKRMKRMLALLLSLAMVLTVSVSPVWADGEGEGQGSGSGSASENAAKIGETEYATLTEALEAADENATITFLKDVTISETISINKSLTIDLNGHNITANDCRALHQTEGTLTITGEGVISSTHTEGNASFTENNSVIRVGDNAGTAAGLILGENATVSTDYCYGITYFGTDSQTVRIDGTVDVTGNATALSGNGTSTMGDANVTVNGTVKSQNDYAIYNPQDGTLNINGTVEGKGGIEVKSGATTVTVGGNASIKATAAETSHTFNADGCSTSGYALVAVNNSGYKGGASITVNGGTINGEIGIVDDDENVAADKKAKFSITGGTFSDLAGAVKYAAAGETITEIKLLRDCTLTDKLTVAKNLTIDGADYTITGDCNDAAKNIELTESAEVTIKNATLTDFGKTADTVTGAGVIKIDAGTSAKLIAENLNIKDFNRAAIDARSGEIHVKNCNIDCDNGQTNRLTKGIVAYTKATIENSEIVGSKSTYEGWSANGIETCAGAEVTVTATKIESMKGGISVARNYGTAGASETERSVAKVTLSDCDIEAKDYAFRVYQGSTGVPAKDNTSALLTVEDGYYIGDVRVGVGSGCEDDGQNTISIKGGYYSENPSEFAAAGYVAKQNTEEATKHKYAWVVNAGTKPENAAKVATKEPEAESHVSTEKADAGNAAKDALLGTKKIDVSGNVIEAAATTEADKNTVTKEAAALQLGTALEEQICADDVKIVVQTYTKTIVKDVTLKNETTQNEFTEMTVDIQPMMRKVATKKTTDDSAIKTEGYEKNAVILEGEEELNIIATVNVVIPLSEKFVNSSGEKYTDGAELDVVHKDKFIYKGTVTKNDSEYFVTFTNPNGFSEFKITPDAGTVASVTQKESTVYFDSLQGAADYVENLGTVQLVKDASSNATVSRAVSFYFEKNNYLGDIVAGSGYVRYINDRLYTFTLSSPGSGGGGGGGGAAVSTKPTVSGNDGGTVKAVDGGALITPDAGYKIAKITVNGKEVTIPADGKLTGLKASDKVQVTFEKEAAAVAEPTTEAVATTTISFNDVATNDWYAPYVSYVTEKGIMNGTGDGKFSPDSYLTRGMAMTMLARYAGETVDGTGAFWYEKGMNWAKEKGVSDGLNPNNNITREELVTMIYRYAQLCGESKVASVDLSSFSDANTIEDYAKEAVSWAVSKGIINGMPDGTFAPKAVATRAQVAKIFTAYAKYAETSKTAEVEKSTEAEATADTTENTAA